MYDYTATIEAQEQAKALLEPDALGEMLTRYLADFADDAVVAQHAHSGDCLLARALASAGYAGTIIRAQTALIRIDGQSLCWTRHSPFSMDLVRRVDLLPAGKPVLRTDAIAIVRAMLTEYGLA
jgi:hypothetical protein